MYKVGILLIEIPKVALVKFKGWLKYPENRSIVHDKRFCEAMFHILVKAFNSSAKDIQWENIKLFVHSLLEIRVGDDENERLSRLEQYYDEAKTKWSNVQSN